MTILISAGMLYIAWKKFPVETRRSNADAAEQISGSALALVIPLRSRVEELEKDLQDKERVIASMERQIKALEVQINSLQEEVDRKNRVISYEQSALKLTQNWAERLCSQIVSLGAEPVSMKNGE